MAYKSKGGCTPITAKIQKTTKGGIVQPLLNMGAPVKMKASSPAKQGGRGRGLSKEERDKRNYSKNKKQYLEDTKYMENNPTTSSHQNYLDKGGRGDWLSSYDRAYNRKKEFEKNLYDYDKKNKPSEVKEFKTAADYAKFKTSNNYANVKPNKARIEGEAGWAADDAARKNKTNQYDPKNKKYSTGESMTPYSVENGKGKIYGPKVSYDMAYKNRGAAYKDMSKADYIKEAKRQTKSFTGTGKWDAQRKKQKVASTISSKPVKTVSIETKKPTASIDVSTIKPKASKITNAKAAKRSARKTAKAQKVRQKGIEALESGNLTKARRLKRREERIKKRAVKQAEKAIEPKKTSAAKQTAKQQQQKQRRLKG